MAEFTFLQAENVDSLSPLRPFREEKFQEKPLAGSVTKTFADERLLASNLGISFSPSYRFGGSCQRKLYCSHDISKLQTIKFLRGKLAMEKSVTLKKSSFPSR